MGYKASNERCRVCGGCILIRAGKPSGPPSFIIFEKVSMFDNAHVYNIKVCRCISPLEATING